MGSKVANSDNKTASNMVTVSQSTQVVSPRPAAMSHIPMHSLIQNENRRIQHKEWLDAYTNYKINTVLLGPSMAKKKKFKNMATKD